jgi:penicillin amidase
MKRLAVLIMLGMGAAGLLFALQHRFGSVPPMGVMLDPGDGLYRTARQARYPDRVTLRIDALEDSVTIVRDERGVPHIFAENDLDAVAALGYMAARDRLFQLDFVTRVAAGRLSAALGPSMLDTDRYLLRTGMEMGARRTWQRIRENDGIEKRIVEAYVAGVNARLERLAPQELPLEFRLLGYAPDPYTPMDVMRLLQYMTFNLTYDTDSPAYAALRQAMTGRAFRRLYPRDQDLYVPIVPPSGDDSVGENAATSPSKTVETFRGTGETFRRNVSTAFSGDTFIQQHPYAIRNTQYAKGSNNWAVGPRRSATGAPILAGDMHLDLTLPSIWYEAHLATPSMNTYGVTTPGAPLPIAAFNNYVGWTLTNVGADQIDHYALELDSSGTRYRYEGAWRPIRTVVDTIPVVGAAPVLDTLRYAHWGPVIQNDAPRTGAPVAVQWVGHEASTSLRALWGMNHARSEAEMQEAMRSWDTPSQNILVADRKGAISIRSTGLLPVRRGGHGAGLLDGSTDRFAWTGRIPFGELPHARNPKRGYLMSANQQPTDSSYRYYLDHDWRNGFRSLRIDSLLNRKPRHAVSDLARYQSDVRVVQRDLFAPLLDTLGGPLPLRADSLRRMLTRWNGEATLDRPEPLAMWVFMSELRSLAWDEPVFAGRIEPKTWRLRELLVERPASRWLDVQATPRGREDAAGLLRRALVVAADTLAARYGWNPTGWRWGDHQRVVFEHLTGSEALRALWRGPEPWPGFRSTLSPSQPLRTTHSASWRVVVDFSTTPPRGYGVYPGGQSGNPFSRLYDRHLATYLDFRYYELRKPQTPSAMDEEHVASRLVLQPEG